MADQNFGKYAPSYDDYDDGPADFEPEDESALLQQWEEEQATLQAFEDGEPEEQVAVKNLVNSNTVHDVKAAPATEQLQSLSPSKQQTINTKNTQSLINTMLNSEFGAASTASVARRATK